jgi:DNA-binding CsgD family transcriptional regulator
VLIRFRPWLVVAATRQFCLQLRERQFSKRALEVVPVLNRLSSSTKSVPDLLDGPRWVALIHTLGLSPRESDVLRCMFSNERITAISNELGISAATVHTYRERLFRKLGVSSCAQLIAVSFATYVEITQGQRREAKSNFRRVG